MCSFLQGPAYRPLAVWHRNQIKLGETCLTVHGPMWYTRPLEVNCSDFMISRGRWVGVVLAHQAPIKVLYCCELCQPYQRFSYHKLYIPEYPFRWKQCGTLSLENWRLHSLHQTWEKVGLEKIPLMWDILNSTNLEVFWYTKYTS